jgi:putative ABC transport system permease protein
MILHYLKIAGRNLWRTRLYVAINIAGLAIGITCILLAVLYVLDEHHFDDFHINNPNLYRITTSKVENNQRVITGGTGQVQGPVFKAEVPEVLSYARLMGGDIYGDLHTEERALRLQLLFVDDNFLDLFSFRLINGNAKTALSEINSVVITEKTALKFFNRLDVIGRSLQMDADPSARRIGRPLVVSAVIENPPANSSIQFDILFPFKFMQVSFDDRSWLNAYLGTFVLLHPSSNVRAVEQKLNAVYKIHSKDQRIRHQKLTGQNPGIVYGLQRITDIHLNPNELTSRNREGGIVNGSKPIYSYLFLGVAAFILLMASVNFVNISISGSLRRAKEVGVRKVTGSTRTGIAGQFLGESVILCFISFLIGLALAIMLLPVFNQFTGKEIVLGEVFGVPFLILFSAVFLLIILASGFYPAYVLSGFNPVDVLYNRHQGFRGNRFKQGLVVFQFSVAVFLGIASLVSYQQMHFFQTKDLGYYPEQIVRIPVPAVEDSRQIGVNFKNRVKNDSRLSGMSFTGGFGFRDSKINGRVLQSYYQSIDPDYIPMMGISLKMGRNFLADNEDDRRHGVLVNEAFVKSSGIRNLVGSEIGADSYFGEERFKILGVLKDFHYGSLKERIEPMVMVSSEQFGGESILVKINMYKEKEVVSVLQGFFKKLFPGAVFDYSFLLAQNAKEYQQELRWQKIVGYATLLSVTICCVGLFGLAHLSVSQRVKETGIRVVLGAGVLDIIYLFSKEYLKMVLIAIVIAAPFAWYSLNHWLTGFAYHIEIQWWILALAACVAIMITLGTVGLLAMKAGRTNPIKAFYKENG